ncbi:MAG: pirin family protein [Mesonia hippocampi]|uniref:pirin family protein n=1 Tax=Mesonia hippocampi TaxID=1628250 RepID=UPI003F98EDD2
MDTKHVAQIIAPNVPHYVGDAFRVHNFIPSHPSLGMRRMDPFIMLDYNSKFNFSATETPRGVGVHPHKGFETVTIAYKGKIAHHDSAGGGGIISQGDVQWMTAGNGILHKEYHEKEWSKQGGDFQMVQLWVNLPKKDKNTLPKYQSILNSEIPKVKLADETGEIEIIAGNYNHITGAASTFSPINMFNLKLKKEASASFNFPKHYNTCILVIEGNITINQNHEVALDHLALLDNNGENFSITAKNDALVLILSGEPLNEPIAAHGPFVMNTHQEILQAFADFNAGKFGVLHD